MVNGYRTKIKGPLGGRGESSPAVAGKPEKAGRHPSCKAPQLLRSGPRGETDTQQDVQGVGLSTLGFEFSHIQS